MMEKNMTKRSRTIIFFVFVFLFLLATPSIIFYFQGYRFDFETKRVVQTGAFYFKVLPRSVEVYLNGKFQKRTSFLTGSILIENLLPKNYEIEIKKEGYHSWQKNLAVREKQVTEAKDIILFPKNPSFTIVSEKPENESFASFPVIDPQLREMVATSSDKKKVVDSSNYEIWVLFPEEKEEVFITRFSKKIGNVFWLTDHYLIFNVGDKIKIAEIDDRDKINMIDLAEFKNPEIFWDKKSKKLYVLSEGNLYQSEPLLP
jgi:hypothetical protein